MCDYRGSHNSRHEEFIMAIRDEGKEGKGRRLGSGAPSTQTGSVGGMQSGGRTDDLLSGGSEYDQNAQGFVSGERGGQIDTGMGDLGNLASGGAGNRQSQDAGRVARGEKELRNEGEHNMPQTGWKRGGHKSDRES
jgi:hypothetical protein